MRQRLLFALGFVAAGFIGSTGSAAAAFDPTRDELMGITAAVVGALLAVLTAIYAVKWYFGADQQPVIDWPDTHASHGADHGDSHGGDSHASAAHAAPLHGAGGHDAETHVSTGHDALVALAEPPAAARTGIPIAEVSGIEEAQLTTLRSLGVEFTDDLLDKAGLVADRRAFAAQTGFNASQILEWVNRADLMRLSGIGTAFSNLLENAGVDTVLELSRRSPVNLLKRLTEVNEASALVERLPTAADVEGWVAEAKTLPPRVSH